MSMTTVARGVVNGLRVACGLFLVAAATSSAVQAIPSFPSVPEIDAGSMSSSIAMLTAGAFLVKGWCRRK